MAEIKRNRTWVNKIMGIEKSLESIINFVCAVVLIVMLVTMIWQVVSRFVLNLSVPWTDELARYLWISLTYIGAGAAISGNNHVEIAVTPTILRRINNIHKRKAISQVLDIVRFFILIALPSYLLYLAWPYMLKVYQIGQFSASLHLPSWILVGVLVFGLLSMIVHSVFRILIAFGDYDLIIDPEILGKE